MPQRRLCVWDGPPGQGPPGGSLGPRCAISCFQAGGRGGGAHLKSSEIIPLAWCVPGAAGRAVAGSHPLQVA